MYQQVYGSLHTEEVKEWFDAGAAAYTSGNYDEAIEKLQQVVAVTEDYEDGYGLYYLARAYEAKQENEKALPLFQRFAQLHPGTERARYAAQAINRIQPGTQQQPTQPQTPEQPTQQ